MGDLSLFLRVVSVYDVRGTSLPPRRHTRVLRVARAIQVTFPCQSKLRDLRGLTWSHFFSIDIKLPGLSVSSPAEEADV